MFDLKHARIATAASAGTIVELEHPSTGDTLRDADGKAYYVEVRGADAPEVKAIDTKHTNRRNERISKRKDPGLDSEALEAEAVEKLVAATISWYLPPNDGVVLEFNEKSARDVYSDPEIAWIGEQVTKAMVDRKRFLPSPSKI